MFKFLFFPLHLMDEKNDDKGGGGGGDKGDKGQPDLAKQFAELQATNAKLLERFEALEKKSKPADNDEDLTAKAKKDREAKDKSHSDSKAIEAALRFSMGAPEWLKTNAALLPKDIEGIFKASEKQTYDNAVQKDNAIKAGIIQTFFEEQKNLDLLTATQKSSLEDWLKLTKNGKEDKAQQMFDSIFEPTFEMLKRIERAKHLNNGEKNQTEGEKALVDRMMKMSKEHYLGEKRNA